jgi:prepilin-type N-terminal cleavage/methylation domain-containing protein/prepilin-type processing-associated H-X9-DG protein
VKPRLHPRLAGADGFTLVELLVVIAILAILAALLLPTLVRVKDEARKAQCLSNLHQVVGAYYLYNEDHHDHLPTSAMLGYSSYRMSSDPLSLCAYFDLYVKTNNAVWLCPAGRRLLAGNGVNYAWSRAQTLTSETGSAAAFAKAGDTLILWDNSTMTLPSIFGVPESPSGGPPAVSAAFRYYPHKRGRALNNLYLDGHVVTK